jgi:hypothetical protein
MAGVNSVALYQYVDYYYYYYYYVIVVVVTVVRCF